MCENASTKKIQILLSVQNKLRSFYTINIFGEKVTTAWNKDSSGLRAKQQTFQKLPLSNSQASKLQPSSTLFLRNRTREINVCRTGIEVPLHQPTFSLKSVLVGQPYLGKLSALLVSVIPQNDWNQYDYINQLTRRLILPRIMYWVEWREPNRWAADTMKLNKDTKGCVSWLRKERHLNTKSAIRAEMNHVSDMASVWVVNEWWTT